MIINKSYIDDNYEFIKSNFNELVKASLSKYSNSARVDEDLKLDLISLNYYISIIVEFAKYYAYFVDNLDNLIYLYLAGGDPESPILESSDGLLLVVLNPAYYDNYINSVVNTEDTIVNRNVKTSLKLVTDITINTNFNGSGFTINNGIVSSNTVAFEDTIIGSDVNLDVVKITSFVSAVQQSNEIIYKYSKSNNSKTIPVHVVSKWILSNGV